MKGHFAILPTVAALVLMGISAGVLLRMQHSHRLGSPGLLMVDGVVYDEEGGVVNTNTIALPDIVLDYESEQRPVAKAELSWLPKDTTYARRYYHDAAGKGLMLTVVMMGQDRTSIHKPQHCLTGQGWTIERSDELEIEIGSAEGRPLPVMRLIASRRFPDGESLREVKAVYVYWFVADGYLTANHGERMWWMARELLTTGTLQRWAYVSCLAFCNPGQEEGLYEEMERFLEHAVPEFQP